MDEHLHILSDAIALFPLLSSPGPALVAPESRQLHRKNLRQRGKPFGLVLAECCNPIVWDKPIRAGGWTLAAHTNVREVRIFAVINPFRYLYSCWLFSRCPNQPSA
jgi:hypothetical protein